LEPHESYNIDLCLSDYYDLPLDEKITIFYKKDILKYEIEQSSFSMFTSKEKGFSKLFKKTSKEYNQCTQAQINIIYNAKLLAYTISQNAYNDVYYDNNDNAQAQRYLTWFGLSNTSRKNRVKSSLKNIYTVLRDKHIAFDCSCKDSYYAYVYPNNPYNIYLCSGFWSAKLSGIDSQSGTIVHQLSYFKIVADTKDYSFGEYEAKNLAIEFPDYAVMNADSYEYFTENKFFLTSSSFFPWLAPLLLLTN